jgi:hypothetical protein
MGRPLNPFFNPVTDHALSSGRWFHRFGGRQRPSKASDFVFFFTAAALKNGVAPATHVFNAKKIRYRPAGADNGFCNFLLCGNSDHYQPLFPVVDKDYYEADNDDNGKVNYG